MPVLPGRVLMTADAVGGVWTYALELARGLAARGTSVMLATMGPPPDENQRRDALCIPGLELFTGDYRLEWMEEPWEDVRRAGEWLLGLERQHAPDVIHLNNYCHGALPFRAPVLVVGHSCVTSWWNAVRGCEAPREWDRYRAEVARGLAAARMVTAPSRAMLDSLETHYGPLRAGRVIPNGRAPAWGSQPRKQPFLFASGRVWDDAKNIAALGRIAPALPWPVYIAGDTRHPDGGARGCPECYCLGRLPSERVPWWMGRASIYVLPARYEPFGLSILEAALAGCALVLGDIASLRENWDGAAVFVPPDDCEALQRAVASLIDSPTERSALSARAQRRGAAFGRDRMAASYAEAYRELCAARPPARAAG
ncbi:MAG TPA: glycosyltransferase family 4 protein [Bryobacteraceae bacterium]